MSAVVTKRGPLRLFVQGLAELAVIGYAIYFLAWMAWDVERYKAEHIYAPALRQATERTVTVSLIVGWEYETVADKGVDPEDYFDRTDSAVGVEVFHGEGSSGRGELPADMGTRLHDARVEAIRIAESHGLKLPVPGVFVAWRVE